MEQKQLFEKEHIPDLKLFVALSRATNRLNRRAATIFRKHGLSPMQFAVMEALYHKGDLTIGEIIEKILSTGGNMTVVVNNLVRDGYVEKKSKAGDQRASLVSLTTAGIQKMQAVFPVYVADLRQALLEVPNAEKQIVTRCLKEWGL